MKNERSNNAVSEIIGTMLLLIIAVAAFSTVYMNVLSDEGPTPYVHNTVVSYVDGLNIVLEHQGGHPLSLDTEISLHLGSSDVVIHPGDEKNGLSSEDKADGEWNVGEQIVINTSHEFVPFSCLYGSPALDFGEVEILDPKNTGDEENFSLIIENYDGPTNLSKINKDIQWSNGQITSDIQAVNPDSNSIVFKGDVNLKHLIDYQEWICNKDVTELTLTFEYVNGSGGYTNTFFYYFDRDRNTRNLTKNFSNHNLPNGHDGQTPGYTETFLINMIGHSRIGFGIESNGAHGGIWFTNYPMNLNADGSHFKQCVVYDLGKTSIGREGSYLLTFEDWDRSDSGSDNDFQDFIVIVHVVDCS